MCGFVGFCDSEIKDGEVKKNIALAMSERIRHRGPDGYGYYSDENVTLGFNRLKIIDLVGGNQPMVSRDGRYVLCFNGEIYNYKDLRQELCELFSEDFQTESDTEVLLKMLIHYGDRALERLRGMFAFAFYDRKSGGLILVRDPLGIKPLYYGIFDGCFMFASEIKAFLSHPKFKKELNNEALPLYLQFQYVPTEQTAFLGVNRLMPGHILAYSEGKTSVERYFDLPVFEKNKYKGYSFFAERDGEKRTFLPYKRNAKEISRRLDAVLSKAVERHTVSDVTVGGFLSGGVDSGLIASYAKPKKLFTVGFKDQGFDERVYAMHRAQSVGAELKCAEVGAEEFFESLPTVQYHSDEPYANLSAVPLYLLSREAKKQVGVVLSGEGADELFGGYEWYEDSNVGKLYRFLPGALRKTAAKRALNGRIGDFLRRNSGDAEKEFIGQAKIMTETEAYSILNKQYKMLKSPLTVTEPLSRGAEKASQLRKKMHLDMQLWLPFDILNKADKMTMASSLELRVPYLDLSVLSIAEGCGEGLLMRGKTSKYVLRQTAATHIGDEAASRHKKGFPVPFRSWIREKKYAEKLRSAFSGEMCAEFFDRDKLIAMLDEHVAGRSNNARALYTVYSFLVWYGVFFGDTEEKSFTLDTAALGIDKRMNDTKSGIDTAKVKGNMKDKEDEKAYSDNSWL